MARKARHRISYVLPLPNSAGGHRLGVNGLAINAPDSRLYSAGRDGSICTWDLHLNLEDDVQSDVDAKSMPAPPATTLRQQTQAHTHWINDLAFCQPHQALISASSDLTVKLWRPASSDGQPPQTIGLHSDYVKTLALPSSSNDWIASGGLDRKIHLWDLQGGGAKLDINVGDDDSDGSSLLSVEKGSVYALAATDTIIASGGPEKTVRVWDARSGTRITKLVGHTDNIRDVLVSRDGATILSASSDRTVKLWSTAAGRCLYTLTMHDASVWSLFSSHPSLSVFYSTDKNGLVAKTDTRNVSELDEGLSVALCQEHEGVHKVVAAGDHLWTATSRPSINRWRDLATDNLEIDLPERYASFSQQHRTSAATGHVRFPSLPGRRETLQPVGGAAASTDSLSASEGGVERRKLPLKHVLRLSNTAFFPTTSVFDSQLESRNAPGSRLSTIDGPAAEDTSMQPVRAQPDGSIEGQNGLIKHTMLSDRRRVLTLDTAGEVVMWDLLQCVPVRSFGKRHLEDVRDEETQRAVAAVSTTANWCTVDTRTGSLTVVLEEHTCFDAEIYADELTEADSGGVEFREDTRVNLGKWLLRYLFARFIDEEIRRDEEYRSQLLFTHENKRFVPPPRTDSSSGAAPLKITLPARILNGWSTNDSSALSSASTLRPDTTRASKAPVTPSFNIALATPALTSPVKTATTVQTLEMPLGDQDDTTQQPARSSGDYFSGARGRSAELATTPGSHLGGSSTPSEATQEPSTPQVDDAVGKESTTPGKEGLFGKKFRMNMSFGGMKKLGRTATNDKLTSAVTPVEEKDESDDNKSSKNSTRGADAALDDTLFGMLQRVHHAYDESLLHQVQNQQARDNGLPVAAPATIDLPSVITPSLPDETPVLKPPRNTILLIQEDRPEAGGVVDLFEGTVGALAALADSVEKAAPAWLGDVLLKNRLPQKDIAKTSFILEPWGGALPSIGADGNNRLNANRMLRAKKVCAYVAERIEPQPATTPAAEDKTEGEAALRPEEYLELWCQDKLVPPNMTLYTIRTHLWKGPGNDVVLQYKSNGKKALPAFVKTPGIPI